jgi:hypothetical protein
MAARPPSQTVDAAIVAPPPAATESRDAVPAAPRLRPQKTVISKVPVDAAAKTSAPRMALPKSAPVERVNVAAVKPPVTKPAVEPATSKPVVAAMATRPVVEPAPTARAAESPARADVEDSTSVTITGCLELDNGTFVLKNTSGAEAPKSRSWKSGFLRKRSATIDLVDPGDGLRLTRHVGQRVAATGTLTGREMRARALRRVAGSCN